MIALSRFSNLGGPEFHSHAIAKADQTQAQMIGSADTSTFSQRKSVEHNRQIVAGYQAAGVHDDLRRDAHFSQSPHVPARLAAAGETKSPSYLKRREQASFGNPRTQAAKVVPIQRPTFSEPSTHHYNPYA